MRDILTDYDRLAAAGPVGRAIVTSVWGSAPRPEGSSLVATADGRMAGSVSGGCVEGATVEAIGAAIKTGAPCFLTYAVTQERAWEMGLACGGTIKVFVEPRVRPDVLAAARSGAGSVVATVLEGAGPVGTSLVYQEDGSTKTSGALAAELAAAMTAGAKAALATLASRTATITGPNGAVEVFYEVYPRQPTLILFGGVHIAAELVRLAKPLGFRTVVADGREAFLTRERFPDADELILGWPEEAFSRVGIDAASCICLLSHDPKFDEPALDYALRSPAVYIGAIGSRKTQSMRRDRLRASGFTEADIARLHGPIGLDLGGRSPAEIALGILAEITAVRYGRVLPTRG